MTRRWHRSWCSKAWELDFVDMKMSTMTGDGIPEVMDKLVEMIEENKDRESETE